MIVVLPAPLKPDQGDDLAGPDLEVDVEQDGTVGGVGEADVLEPDPPLDRRQRVGARPVLDLDRGRSGPPGPGRGRPSACWTTLLARLSRLIGVNM